VGGRDYGYKGAGLAGLAEVLGGVLTGMRLSIEQDGLALADTRMGHFVMAIDPTLFMTMESFAARLTAYLDAFKSQPGTYAAGGPEWERRRRREAEGIPLPDGLHAELRACAASFKVTFVCRAGKPSVESHGEQRTCDLRRDESRHIGRPDAGESVAETARQRHRRIGEAGGSGEPVGGGDIEPHIHRDGLRRVAKAGKDHGEKAEGRNRLGQPLAGSVRVV
jgi:hypothetical protein